MPAASGRDFEFPAEAEAPNGNGPRPVCPTKSVSRAR